jgi:hypothetical protein
VIYPFRRIEKLKAVPPAERNLTGYVTYVYQLFPNAVITQLSNHTNLVVLEPVSIDRTRVFHVHAQPPRRRRATKHSPPRSATRISSATPDRPRIARSSARSSAASTAARTNASRSGASSRDRAFPPDTGCRARGLNDESLPDRERLGLRQPEGSQRPDPKPAAGQVLLRMKASAINYRDLLVPDRGYGARTGTLPLIMLGDGVGEVVEIGAA